MPSKRRWPGEAVCGGWRCVRGFGHVNYKGAYTERHGCTAGVSPHTHTRTTTAWYSRHHASPASSLTARGRRGCTL